MNDEWVRAWSLQIAGEGLPALPGPGAMLPSESLWSSLATAARSESSPVVRRYMASVLQRLPVERRWDTLTALLQHAEDAQDHNLPQLYWAAAEGGVATDPEKALALLKNCRIPKVREFIVRRLATGSLASN